MIPAVIGNFLFCCCRNDWFSTACWVDEVFLAFWMLEDGRRKTEDGKTARACSRFGHERIARWPEGPKARAARLSQHGRLSHTKTRRHEGGLLDVGWAWDAVGRGLALGKTPPRWGDGSNFEGLGG
jgi:hypothetical protein